MIKSYLRFCVLCVIIGFVSAFVGFHEAHAEGGGIRPNADWGVNRRVRTQASGYVAVNGTFVVQQLEVPEVVRLQKEDGQLEDWTTAAKRSNPLSSKPTAYFGGGGGGQGEVDAGLQYEATPVNTGGALPQAGWMAFISHNGHFTTPLVYNAAEGDWFPWRGSAQSTFQLTYKVWDGANSFSYPNPAAPTYTPPDGAVSLAVHGGGFDGTFFNNPSTPPTGSGHDPPRRLGPPSVSYNPPGAPATSWSDPTGGSPSSLPQPDETKITIWPHQGIAVFPNQTQLFAKRVIGITQGNNWRGEPDGSVFQCLFSAGKLQRLNRPSGIAGLPAGWDDWNPVKNANTTSDVDPAQTGYDVPLSATEGTAPLIFDATDATWWDNTANHIYRTTPAHYKVEFPNTDNPTQARQPNSEGVQEKSGADLVNRYTRETVLCNLRNAARPWGFRVEPSQK